MTLDEWLPAHPEIFVPLILAVWGVWGGIKLREWRREKR